MSIAAETRGVDPALLTSQQSFERVLGRKTQKTGREAAREAAEDFVSMSLVLPVLKQLRESNMAAPPFAPGDSERRFGALLDAEIAARMVRGSRFGIVDAVAEQLMSRGGASGGEPA